MPPAWSLPSHLKAIAEHLDAVTRGDCDRLAIFMPPRHGKTETLSVRYPVYRLQRDPAMNCLITGYNERFARRLGRKARNVAQGRVPIAPDKAAADEWHTTADGLLMTRGVGSPPTGVGFGLIVIDDPIRRREDAESEVYREKVWDWYTDDLYTRLEPGGAIILVMCLTGETPVLMADSTEKALRDIRVGDKVATYENGRLSTSVVLNWKNQGKDHTYAIGMESGIIVKGNERHPFLVERDGYTEWVKIRDLKAGDKILRARNIGENGEGLSALKRTAKNPQSARGSAVPITIDTYGQAGIEPLRSIRIPNGQGALKTDTTSQFPNTNPCLPHRVEDAQYAESCPDQTSRRIGETNSPLITTTLQEKSEGFCATSATGQSGTEKQSIDYYSLLSTFEIIPDRIVSVAASGYEDVFDIQIERTENFIANGLVSHNTLWHEDDLGARAIASEPGRWTVLKLPALAEENDTLGRVQGAALWPERFNVEQLHRIRDVMSQNEGLRSWEALYQQNPTPREGVFFKVSKLEIVDAVPAGMRSCRAWDMGASEAGDFSAGVKVSGPDATGVWYVEHVNRGRWSTDERNRQVRQTAELDGRDVRIHVPQDPGAAGKDAAIYATRQLAGFSVKTEPVSGSKEIRADPFSSQVNAGNVRLVRGEWNRAFIEELRSFPGGKFDDQVDAVSDAFTELSSGKRMIKSH
jgi:predicted phage terminase large subunit-like protein